MAKATTAILLAAGEGKRMVSKKQKVMHNQHQKHYLTR